MSLKHNMQELPWQPSDPSAGARVNPWLGTKIPHAPQYGLRKRTTTNVQNFI